MGDDFSPEKEDIKQIQWILERYLSEATPSRIDKLNSELGCIDENQNYSLEDLCYFAAKDIADSGYVTKFKEFLEEDGEIMLSSRVEEIIDKYTKNKKPEEDSTPEEIVPIPKQPTHSIEGLIQKLEHSLRKAVKVDPTKEFDIHRAIELLLVGTEFEEKYTRDVKSIPWSVTSAIPDFIFDEIQTVLEVKICKEKKCIKKISDEMLRDINPYKNEYPNIIFLVYDMGQIPDVDKFKDDFNSIENVTMIIVKH
jgi:hypothetical protein